MKKQPIQNFDLFSTLITPRVIRYIYHAYKFKPTKLMMFKILYVNKRLATEHVIS